MKEKIVKSNCRMCHGQCGVLVHIKNGEVVEVEGDPDCPANEGWLCAKGKNSINLLYHKDRLKHPLRREEDEWKRIGWDEALHEIANKFLRIKEEFGAQSIGIASGTGRPYKTFTIRFANCLGTPNTVGPGHNCYLPRNRASHMTCGLQPECDVYGFGDVLPKCIVVWGANLTESGGADGLCGYKLAKAIQKTDCLIVIDPRKTPEAKKADHWIQIRPGTDDFLALSMMNVIIEENLYDKKFVERWTIGFDKLAKRVAEYPPDKVEKITWIPSEIIENIARTYATTNPACIRWGVGIEKNMNNFQTARAILCLRGITGNIDVPGGDVFWVPPEGVKMTSMHANPNILLPEKLPQEMRKKKLGDYKLGADVPPHVFWNTVLTEDPYPIKALLIIGSNPLLTHPNPGEVAQALEKIDYVVAVDLFMTPTTERADIVLPAASWLEQNDVADLHHLWGRMVRQKVEQVGQARDDKGIIIDLAKRMGFEDCFPWKSVKDYCNWVLEDSGITFDEFKEVGIIRGKMRYRKYESEGFDTTSGKFELYCSRLEEMGFDPLPYAVDPPKDPSSNPEIAKEYPFILLTGARIQPFFCSEYRQIKPLRKLNPDPLVEINSGTAKKLGIKEGEWIHIESPEGRIKQKASLTEGIHPKVVSAQYGWWFPERSPPDYGLKESNINLLISGGPYDPHTGGEELGALPCKIYKV